MHPLTLALHLGAMGALLAACWIGLRQLALARRWNWPAAAIGAATFVIAARMLGPLALHAAGVTALLGRPEAAPWWLLPLLAAAAALFEEFGRLAGLGVTRRRPVDAVTLVWSFAAGYAVAELLLIGVLGHGQLLLLAHADEARRALLQDMPPAARAVLQRSLADLGPMSALWLLTERLAAAAFQVGLTLLVAAAIEARSVARFACALALHFAIDLPAAAYQVGAAPLWLVELVYVVAGIGALRWLQRRWLDGRAHKGQAAARAWA
jgi:uncharacterized membrane protein YhfC